MEKLNKNKHLSVSLLLFLFALFVFFACNTTEEEQESCTYNASWNYSLVTSYDGKSETDTTIDCDVSPDCMGSSGSSFLLTTQNVKKTISGSTCEYIIDQSITEERKIERSENSLFLYFPEDTTRSFLEFSVTNDVINETTYDISTVECERILSDIVGTLDYTYKRFLWTYTMTITEKDGEKCTESELNK